MAEQTHTSADAGGLPPVIPPSGRMIAQLFVVPGLIVGGSVAILLLFSWLAGGSRTPEGFLDGLRNGNPEVRWRAASDLAQVLQRDDTLASDPKFGIDLAARLNESLPAMRKPVPVVSLAENDAERRSAGEARFRFMVQRSEVQYLIACMGNLSTPVGAPLLCQIAVSSLSPDPKTDALLRRQAVWALAALGNNRQRFARLPPTRQQQVLSELDQIASKVGDEANWAKSAANILRDQGTQGIIAALAKCATADDPFLRRETALALSFWRGTSEENTTADDILARLVRDDGHGEAIRITEKD